MNMRRPWSINCYFRRPSFLTHRARRAALAAWRAEGFSRHSRRCVASGEVSGCGLAWVADCARAREEEFGRVLESRQVLTICQLLAVQRRCQCVEQRLDLTELTQSRAEPIKNLRRAVR